MALGTYVSMITLNVTELNAPTKRHRLADWIQKQNPYICCLQETHFKLRDTYRLKVRDEKKTFHTNGNQKKAGVATLVTDTIDFKIKTVTWGKERHYIINPYSINPRKRYNNCNYIYIINKGAPPIRQMVTAIKGEIDSNTIVKVDFNASFTTNRQILKENKETPVLNDILY